MRDDSSCLHKISSSQRIVQRQWEKKHSRNVEVIWPSTSTKTSRCRICRPSLTSQLSPPLLVFRPVQSPLPSRRKCDVPIISAGSAKHQMIHCVQECFQAKERLGWNGEKLFDDILDVSGDPSDGSHWELLVANNTSVAVTTFQGFIKQHIKHEFSNNQKACNQHQEFLEHELKRHMDETVHESVQPPQHPSKSIPPWLPGAPSTGASHSSLKTKKMAFKSVPREWRDNCEDNDELKDHDLHQLTTCAERNKTLSQSAVKSQPRMAMVTTQRTTLMRKETKKRQSKSLS